MSAALAADHPGATVEAVTVEGRDDGTNRRARLGVTYSAGDGPATVFAKAADPAHKALIRMTAACFMSRDYLSTKCRCRWKPHRLQRSDRRG